LYPFKEYHEAVAASENEAKTIFFEEWFVRNAINQGLPLNTVLSTEEFAAMTDEAKGKLRETIVFVPASGLIGENARLLSSFVQEGGKAIVYGAVTDPQWQALMNIRQERGLEGEFELTCTLQPDTIFGDTAASRIFKHDPLTGGGTLNEVLNDANDRATKVAATASQGDQVRILALTRELPEWNGGKVGWVRGSLPFEGGSVTQLPVRQADGYADLSILVRQLLREFGYELRQIKHEETNKPALLFVSRRDNGFYFTGCRQDTSVALSMRFPDGVPIMTGQTIRAGQGAAAYSLDRTYHEECRVFVDQRETTTVFCREYMPVPTPRKSSTRFIHVTGLREATVTIYPPLASLIAANVEVRADQAYLDLKDCVFGDKLVITNVSGEMEVTW